MIILQLIAVIIILFIAITLLQIPLVIVWWKLKVKKIKKLVRGEIEEEKNAEEERKNSERDRIAELPDIRPRGDKSDEDGTDEVEDEEGVEKQKRVQLPAIIPARKDKREPITFG